MNVVYDTNVYISGLFWSGPPEDLLRIAAIGEVKLFVSSFILEEISKTLSEAFELPKDAVDDALSEFAAMATMVYPQMRLNLVRDKKDNRILECAAESCADYLVTGDSDLLVLKRYKNIKIVTPKEFLDMLNRGP